MKKIFSANDFKKISADEVPAVSRPQVPWEEIFGSIKKGEAIIIEPDQLASSTVREALKRYKSKGRFKNLIMTTRQVMKNKYRSYISNPREKTE